MDDSKQNTALRFLKRLGLGLLILLIGVILLLQTRAVQDMIGRQLTQRLSQKWEHPVRLNHLHLSFFDRLYLQGLYVEDQGQDTLLYVDELEIRLVDFSLSEQWLDLEAVRLQGVNWEWERLQGDSLFNLDYFLQSLAPDNPDPEQEPSDPVPWKILVDKLDLDDIRMRRQDEKTGTLLRLNLGSCIVRQIDLDLETQCIGIHQWSLSATRTSFEQDSVVRSAAPSTPVSREPLSFPFTGWTLQLDELLLWDNQVAYDNWQSTPTPSRLDLQHMEWAVDSLDLRGFHWQAESLETQLKHLQARETGGYQLSDAQFTLDLRPETITLDALKIVTPDSRVQNSTGLQFSDWATLDSAPETIEAELVFPSSYLSWLDVKPFLPEQLKRQLRVADQEQIRWEGELRGSLLEADMPGFFLQVGKVAKLDAAGKATALNRPKDLQGDVMIHQLWVEPTGLASLLPELKLPTGTESLGRVNLAGSLRGGMEVVRGDSLSLTTEVGTRLVADLDIKGLTDSLPYLEAMVYELFTRAEHWQPFVADSLPAEMYRLGDIQYAGQLAGNQFHPKLDGQIRSEAGEVRPNLDIQFSDGYTTANYQGSVQLNRFDLGRLLDQEAYGPLDGRLRVNGKGLSPDSLSLTGEGQVDQFITPDYTYQGLNFSGQWNQGEGTIAASMGDPHLQFEMEGRASMKHPTPDFLLTVALDTLNAGAMGWRERKLAASGQIDASWQGLQPDSLRGEAIIRQLHLSSDTLHFYNPQLEAFMAAESDSGKTLQVRSPFLWVDLNGRFSYRDLPTQLYDQLAVHLPVGPDTVSLTRDTTTHQQADKWELQVKTKELLPLLAVWDPAWKQLDSLEISASVERSRQKLELDVRGPNVAYEPLEIGEFHWSVREEEDRLQSRLFVDSISVQDSFLHALNWEVIAREDTLFSDFRLGDYEMDDRLATAGQLTRNTDQWKYEVISPFVLNGKNWEVSASNALWFGPFGYFADRVALSRNDRLVEVQTDTASGYPRHSLSLNQFALKELTELSGWKAYRIEGNASGTFNWEAREEDPFYTANMDVRQLGLEELALGTLSVRAERDAVQPQLLVDLALEGEKDQMRLAGNYHLENKNLNLELALDRLRMQVVELFAAGEIRDSRGQLSGNATVRGPLSGPSVEGYLGFQQVSTFVDYMQTRYAFGQDTIFFDEEKIRLERIDFRDQEDRQATLTGQIKHDNFRDFSFDTRLSTERFQFLQTDAQNNDLFYGDLVLRMNLLLNGTLEQPRLKIDASTLDPTNLVLITPTGGDPTVAEGGFIIYGNPEQIDSSWQENGNYELNSRGFEMLMQLALNPDARLKVVIDPTTGDYLTCRGKADLTTEVERDGSVSVLGNYVLEEGTYSLNYENVFKRNFNLKKGSTITFVGDPEDSRFDIAAVYRTKTTYLDLLQNEISLSEVEMRAARRRQEVEVVMRMQGDLERPELHFDIQLPESEQSSPLAGIIEQKLAQLREKETDLNSQVFGLLLFNSFIASGSSSSSFSIEGTSEAIALSSLSKLITNQLNKLASRHLGGVDLQVGVDSYKAQTELSDNTITEVELGLSKRAFNDRLTIEVGGNLDLSSEEESTQLADFTTVAGDFVLDYQLDAQGRYHVQVFQKSQYDLINESNSYKTGVGFSFEKQFNRKRKKHEAADRE